MMYLLFVNSGRSFSFMFHIYLSPSLSPLINMFPVELDPTIAHCSIENIINSSTIPSQNGHQHVDRYYICPLITFG